MNAAISYRFMRSTLVAVLDAVRAVGIRVRSIRPANIHYTSTYSSWLNQVERWFGLIMQQAIRRGSFRSVGELVQKIDAYVASYNLHRRPFV
jgi:hypothetical protein